MNESERVFTEVLGCDRTNLYLNKKSRLDKVYAKFISETLKRRICGEPLAYILGKCEFMGLEFKLNQDVLIPRPDTEILVETVLKYVPQCPSAQRSSYSASVHKCRSAQVKGVDILEIGTGSGCIAVSLAKFLPEGKIVATDISETALAIARENAELNNVADRVKFIQSDLFSACGLQPAACELIVSNPPYIPKAEIKKLQPEIKYEPSIALDGGKDGLDFYRRIIEESPRFLKKAGFLILEMGFDQCESIKRMFKLSGKFEVKEVIKDYNNIQRVIVARLNTADDR